MNTKIRRVSIEEIIGLRHHILRAGMPVRKAWFIGDNDASTWHLAVFPADEYGLETGAACTCASFMFNELDRQPAWQLRGMATEPTHQRKGLGRNLLGYAEQAIPAESGIHLFWCNARLSAVLFYEKLGWNVISDEFDIPAAGPHRKMVKEL